MGSTMSDQPPVDTNKLHDELPGAIQWVGDQFEKMLLGIPKFLFVIFPRWLWQWLRETLPTVMQTVRMLTLAVLWAAVAFGPFVLWQNVDQIPDQVREAFNAVPSSRALVSAWTLVAVAGSVYGLFYVALRRRRLRKAKRVANADRSGPGRAPAPPQTGTQSPPSPGETSASNGDGAASSAKPQWDNRQPGGVAVQRPPGRRKRRPGTTPQRGSTGQ